MAASGMRYKKTKGLIDSLEVMRTKMEDLLKRLEDRTEEITKVYGGDAAENFKSNVVKASQMILDQIKEVTTKLTTEAETQHDAYIAQEQRLKTQIAVK